jgi:hypothetical protein
MKGNHGCSNPREQRDMASIWTRARVQAFAHQVAVERLEKKVKALRIKEMAIAVSGIALLVVGYTLGLGLPQNAGFDTSLGLKSSMTLASHVCLFLSTLVGIYGLYHVVTSERDQLITLQSRHKLLLRMFMNVSGKTRSVVADIYDPGFYKFNIAFLHDTIASLQTAGENPSDDDYTEAHRRHFAVLDFSRSEIADSFAPEQLLPATVREARLCERLAEHLRNRSDDLVTMSFDEIERVTEDTLPEVAHRADWWSSPADPEASGHRSWIIVGYDAHLVSNSRVDFSRNSIHTSRVSAPNV